MLDGGSNCTDEDYGFSIGSICHNDTEKNETPIANATSLKY